MSVERRGLCATSQCAPLARQDDDHGRKQLLAAPGRSTAAPLTTLPRSPRARRTIPRNDNNHPVPVDATAASDAMRELSKAVNELTGKPEQYIMCAVQGGVPMW